MHISPVIVYDQSHREGGSVRFKEILTVFQRNLHKSAVFRRKLAGGAGGLDTPYWVEDPDFDLEFHVRHIALPKPGDWRQFCILLARLQARGLDMQRPLWEAYVIEGLNRVQGLPENSFAIMLKIHHAAIDGVSGAEIIAAIHSLTDEIEPPEVIDTWQGERNPSPWTVWSRAYLHNLRRPVKIAETLGTLVPAMVRANRAQAEQHVAPRPMTAKTRFNGRVSSARVTDTLVMDLEEVKAVRRSLGDTTINDVIVSIVGGALRKYLLAKNELPEDSLSCGAPVNVRAERNSESRGNQVSIMMMSLATDIEDPVKRLRAVHRSADQAKSYSGTLGNNVMMDLSESIVPRVMGWGFRAATLAATRTDISMPCHTVVSNVPGPQAPLHLAGAKVSLMMGIGPLMDMLGLFHAVISGAGKISINFISCREMMPDPDFYKRCLEESWSELRAAADRVQKKAARGGRPKSGTGAKSGSRVAGRTKTKAKVKAAAKAATRVKPAAKGKSKSSTRKTTRGQARVRRT